MPIKVEMLKHLLVKVFLIEIQAFLINWVSFYFIRDSRREGQFFYLNWFKSLKGIKVMILDEIVQFGPGFCQKAFLIQDLHIH